MKILVIGGGGREHALVRAIAKSPLTTRIVCAPGNGGIAEIAECVTVEANDTEGLLTLAREHEFDLTVIGPEAPLIAGLADRLRSEDFAVVGPGELAAQIEGSKGFMKELAQEYGIPSAAYAAFSSADDAIAHLSAMRAPYVIKADGIAAGKGVVIAETMEEACQAIEDMFAGRYGEAGKSLVILEEFLSGEEASFFVLTDGKTVIPFGTAQDHKRAGEGDTGPNTGGMGAYSPAPVMTDEMIDKVMVRIIAPTLDAMRERGMAYQGILYCGLMITEEGPKLIEYNVRFGDPEAQVILPRLKSDIVPVLMGLAKGTLKDCAPLEWSDQTALTVVMAAKGYPGDYQKGSQITGLDKAAAVGDVEIFHAGTVKDGGRLTAQGGRVLNITGLGATVAEAKERAYEAAGRIDWPGGFYRRDIGWRALSREDKAPA